jgi:KDO2-lipid IV(A) lauroyltransferase
MSSPPILDKRYWQRLVLRFCSFLSVRVQKMPRERSMRLGVSLGHLAYHLAARPRRYADGNLRLIGFPSSEATPAERDAFIRRVFVHFAKTAIDFLCGPALTPADMQRLVRAEGFEHVEAALARGKGVIIITAHFGNWEMLGRWLAQHGVPMTVVARDPENPEFAAWVRQMRESAGFTVASKGGSVRELLGRLKKNLAVGLLPDQNSGDLFVPFLGVPAGTVAGPATLALHTGAALLPSYCARMPDDTYRLMILPPIPTHATGDKDADVARIMGEVNRVLEGVVREYPDQWLWLHNRWKSAFEEKNRERAWSDADEQERHEAFRRWEGFPA